MKLPVITDLLNFKSLLGAAVASEFHSSNSKWWILQNTCTSTSSLWCDSILIPSHSESLHWQYLTRYIPYRPSWFSVEGSDRSWNIRMYTYYYRAENACMIVQLVLDRKMCLFGAWTQLQMYIVVSTEHIPDVDWPIFQSSLRNLYKSCECGWTIDL